MGRTSSSSFLALLAWLVCAAPAAALPGPPLQAPRADLRAALECPDDLRGGPTPVLLVHGTGAVVEEDYGSNYLRFLPDAGIGVCAVQLPDRGVGDLQRNVEYVVWALRHMARERGGKVSVIGHSQGGTLPLVALRSWPDLARKVDDYVAFAPATERGTTGAKVVCATAVTCSTSFTQFDPDSRFNAGFASRPSPRGPSYTAFATRTDAVVTPAPEASRVDAPGAVNVVLQDVCPQDVADHLSIVAEEPLRQLTIDALTHRGAADLERAAPLTCGYEAQAGIGQFPGLLPFALGIAEATNANRATEEPPTRCYLDVTCPKPRLRPRLKVTVGKRVTRGRVVQPPNALRQCGGRVRVRRRSSRVLRTCRFKVRVRSRGRATVRFGGTRELLPVTVRRR